MRLFSGIPLVGSSKLRVKQILTELKKNYSGFRWVDSENVHISIHFFGEKKLEEVQIISDIMKQVINRFSARSIQITDADAFPDSKKPRVIYLRLEDNGFLKKIYQEISSELNMHNIKFDEKPYIPHLTLGRIKNRYSYEMFPEVEPLRELLDIKQINLYQSVLKSTGAVYTVLSEFKLIDNVD